MEDKPTIQYDAEGRVVAEPDIERRVASQVADEVAQLRRDVKGIAEPGTGLPCSRLAVEDMRIAVGEEGRDCCEVSNAIKKVANECGMETLGGGDIDCCARYSLGQDMLALDKRLGGTDG